MHFQNHFESLLLENCCCEKVHHSSACAWWSVGTWCTRASQTSEKNHSRFQDLCCLCSTLYCVRATGHFRGLASFKTRATDNSKNNYVLFTRQWDSRLWTHKVVSLCLIGIHPNGRVLLRRKEICVNINRRWASNHSDLAKLAASNQTSSLW